MVFLPYIKSENDLQSRSMRKKAEMNIFMKIKEGP
jgi:hypothetical protein